MNEREHTLIRETLVVLDRLRGNGPQAESLVQGEVSVRVAPQRPTLDEFEATLRQASERRWVQSVRNDTTGALRWTITDAGRLALLDL